MSTHGHAAAVEAFFREVHAADLLLPDGWFGGRPMENQHELTFVVERPRRLLMELDDQLLLSFSPQVKVTRTTSQLALRRGTPALVLSGFGQCTLEYVEYGSDRPHERSYNDGQVILVAPT